MKFLIFCIQAAFLNSAWSMSILQNSPLPSNLGQNNWAATRELASTLNAGLGNTPNTISNVNNCSPNAFANNGIFTNKPAYNTNLIPNNLRNGNAILANDLNTNMLANANTAIVNEQMIGQTLPATITSANFIPIANIPSEMINNLPMSPIISEIIPSLQYGDVTMSGDLPIGGTIKVCGCFPVYGMINVDGSLPSTGTAVVAESFGNQLSEVISQCANQVIS